MKNCEHCQNIVNNNYNNCNNNNFNKLLTTTAATPLKMRITTTNTNTTTATNINATDMVKSIHCKTKTTTATPATTKITTLPITRPAIATTTAATNQLCQHQLQQQQQQHRHGQRCSSVGSIGSSICGDTLSSSHSGSTSLSPTDSTLIAPPTNSHQHHLHQHMPNNNNNNSISHHQHIALLSANKSKTFLPPSNVATLSSANNPTVQGIEIATRSTQPEKTQTVIGLPPTVAAPLLHPLPPLLSSATATANGLPAPQQQHQAQAPQSHPAPLQPVAPPPPAASTLPPLVGGLGAAAMAANLAESFSLLHQQAHHFRDILYAAHLLGRGKTYKYNRNLYKLQKIANYYY